MIHEQKLQFGAPMTSKAAFDEEVADTLKREDLKPLKLYFNSGQTSYLFTPTARPQDWDLYNRTEAAQVRVMSEKLPRHSSSRRAAAIFLELNRFVEVDEAAEDQVISNIFSLVAEGSDVEQHYWPKCLRSSLLAMETGTGRYIISKEKQDRFAKRLTEAGL